MEAKQRRAREMIAANAALRERCDEFASGAMWLNVSRAPTLGNDLAGRVVLLHFFTPSRAAAWSTLSDAAWLERKYRAAGLTILGILAPRFAHEHRRDGAIAPLLRFGIDHPLAIDSDAIIVDRFGISSLPAHVLLGSDGAVLGRFIGAGHREELDAAIEAALDFERRLHRLAGHDLPLRLERNRVLPGELSFPSRIATHPALPLLYVADSNHDRILELSLDGRFRRAFGSGTPGLQDGEPTAARFLRPQGLALTKDALFVADTGNHAIRRIDLDNGTVSTLAGTGRRGRGDRLASNAPRATPLDAPLDLAVAPDGDSLFVALAGEHRIVRLATDGSYLEPFAGDGVERLLDGPRAAASFAQPAGLSLLGATLFVTDSGASALRAIDLERGDVRTIAGGSREPSDLDHAGDDDGPGHGRRFALPLGISAGDRELFVADAGTHTVKRVDPASGEVTTIAGVGIFGHSDGPGEDARFFEPSGIAWRDGRLYVADAANQRLRVVDAYSAAVSTLAVKHVPLPRARIVSRARTDELPDVPPELPGMKIAPLTVGRVTPGLVTLEITLEVGDGFEFADEAPSQFHLRRLRGAIDIEIAKGKVRSPSLEVPVYVDGPGEIELFCVWYVCGGDACHMRVARFPLSLTVSADGVDHVRLAAPRHSTE
jgi:DNA-binding beta-propeller fold protein YncE